MSPQPVVVVEHEEHCPPGFLGDWLREAGVDLDVRRPYRGDALPAELSHHAGMLVLGGEMGANDDTAFPWLTEVKRLVVAAADRGCPVLGVCLGHQLAAVALGGAVQPSQHGQQIGVLGVGWTREVHDDPLLGAPAARGPRATDAPAVQWNHDVVTRLPPGCVVLARTARGELQAARFAPSVWGVQWHPEAGAAIVGAWAERDRDDALERGVDVDAYVADVAAAHDAVHAAWPALAQGFAAVCRAEPGVVVR